MRRLFLCAFAVTLTVGCTPQVQRAPGVVAPPPDPLNESIWLEGGTYDVGDWPWRDWIIAYDDNQMDQRLLEFLPTREAISSGFWIQQHEVTNEEYRRFDPTHRFPEAEARHPVLVSFQQAEAYAESLGGALPTEAQWAYAAKGQENRWYPWGRERPDCERANNVCGGVQEVMSFPGGATPDGVHDLGGNVREWVRDWLGPPVSFSSNVVDEGSMQDWFDEWAEAPLIELYGWQSCTQRGGDARRGNRENPTYRIRFNCRSGETAGIRVVWVRRD